MKVHRKLTLLAFAVGLIFAFRDGLLQHGRDLQNSLSNVQFGRTPASSDRFEHLTEAFENEISQGKIPGAVILILQHGQPIYHKTFGVREMTARLPMTEDTIFSLHSMTKPITSVAAMMLVDEGRIALTDPLAKYIPEFTTVKVGVESVAEDGTPYLKLVPPDRPVSIADLLRHTSGITYEGLGGKLIQKVYADANLLAGPVDNKILAERLAQLPLSRQPGSLWRYGHSTDVLGRVIEIVSGQTIYEFEKKNIFDPLGMTSTKFILETDAERLRMAAPLPDDTDLNLDEHSRLSHPEWLSGGGGLVSTAIDYSLFAQMLLNGGQSGGQKYLSPEAFKEMTTDHVGPDSGVGRDYYYYPGDGFGFGYGFGIRVEAGKSVPPQPGSIGELKWDSAAGTYFGVDPKLDLVYVLMEQTGKERGRLVPLFRQLVYEGILRAESASN